MTLTLTLTLTTVPQSPEPSLRSRCSSIEPSGNAPDGRHGRPGAVRGFGLPARGPPQSTQRMKMIAEEPPCKHKRLSRRSIGAVTGPVASSVSPSRRSPTALQIRVGLGERAGMSGVTLIEQRARISATDLQQVIYRLVGGLVPSVRGMNKIVLWGASGPGHHVLCGHCQSKRGSWRQRQFGECGDPAADRSQPEHAQEDNRSDTSLCASRAEHCAQQADQTYATEDDEDRDPAPVIRVHDWDRSQSVSCALVRWAAGRRTTRWCSARRSRSPSPASCSRGCRCLAVLHHRQPGRDR